MGKNNHSFTSTDWKTNSRIKTLIAYGNDIYQKYYGRQTHSSQKTFMSNVKFRLGSEITGKVIDITHYSDANTAGWTTNKYTLYIQLKEDSTQLFAKTYSRNRKGNASGTDHYQLTLENMAMENYEEALISINANVDCNKSQGESTGTILVYPFGI